MVMLDAISSYFVGCVIPWQITTESQLFANINYINPGVYLFSCKLLSNYRILNVYFSFTCLCCLVHLCSHHSRALNYRNRAKLVSGSPANP